MTAFIVGSGAFVPDRIVSNEELAGVLGLDPNQIFKASGIRRRRWADKGTTTSSLAASALSLALERAELTSADLDYLLLGTMTPDRFIPGSASAVQHQLGLRDIACLDIRATCCNTLYGLQVARALIESKTARHVAICSADVQSPWLNLSPEAAPITILFGDGASGLIVSGEQTSNSLEIIDVLLATDGRFIDELGVRCPGTEFGNTRTYDSHQHQEDYAARMIGQSVILQATRKMTAACQALLERNGLQIDQVRWLVPHQANANLLALVARALHFSRTDGVISVLEEFGNTSSAAMGMALDKLLRAELAEPGDYVLLPAFGSGFTWGAALCRA